MGLKHWKRLILTLLPLIPLISSFCVRENALERITKTGEITVLTRNNAHCYYTYRGEPMGFEYDLAKAFSKYLGVKLKVVTPAWEGLIKALNSGKGDFIAASLSIIPSREAKVDFSNNYMPIQQWVILHKDNHQIKGVRDLSGRTVHVRGGTSYEERLKELRGRGLKVGTKLYEDTPTEELIRMVANKEIEVTIADTNIARLNRRYYPDVRMAFPIEEPQTLGWAVKKGEKALRKEINKFFRKIKNDGTYGKIYEKYYANLDIFDYVDLKKYHLRIESRLPKYKTFIQNAAKKYGFDWRLVAAMIYQESHFDPGATSHTGVAGIMQLTENTANEMGVKDRLNPRESIIGGVKYLRKIYNRINDAEDPDRLYIALASYNVGRGHVLDAQAIAKKKGLNPDSWSALREILPDLRYPKFYRETRHGYCRGTEPVRYVQRILTYYDILKRESLGQ